MVFITQAKCVYCTVKGKSKAQGKGKGHPITCHEGTEGEYRYDATLSLTSALDGDGLLTSRPSRFTPGRNWYPFYRRLGGQVLYVWVRKISPHRDSILHCIYIYIYTYIYIYIHTYIETHTYIYIYINPPEICGGQRNIRTGVSPSTSVCPCKNYSINAPYSILILPEDGIHQQHSCENLKPRKITPCSSDV